MSSVFRPLLLATLCCVPPATAQSPAPPQPTLIKDVRLAEGADAPIVSILMEHGRIRGVLAAGEELPVGWIEVEGAGALAVPAFVDAFTVAGIETPEPEATRDAMSDLAGNVHIGMREANRKGLQPSLSGASVFSFSEDSRKSYRDQGFGAMHSSPSGQVLGGQTLVTGLGAGALRDRIVSVDLFQAAALRASGPGYPSTLMGYLSHLRQFVSDAKWHALRLERQAAGKADRRPPYDADLEAVGRLLAGEQSLLCSADDYGDILRWIQFGKQHEMQVVIAGGRDAWMVTDQLLEAQVPVLLGLDWGDEVEDPDAKKDAKQDKGKEAGAEPSKAPSDPEATASGAEGASETTEVSAEEAQKPADQAPAKPAEAVTESEPATGAAAPATQGEATETKDETKDAKAEPNWIYEEPLEVRRERRRQWIERRDCAMRLHEAGVPFAIGTNGQSPKDLMKNLRELVKAGLPAEVAMGALTTRAAELLGTSKSLGRIEVGYSANIALWNASPLAEKAKLHWLFIDGERFEFDVKDKAAGDGPAEGVDLNGEWRLTYNDGDAKPATLSLTMEEDGTLSGVLTFQGPAGDALKCDLSGAINGKKIDLQGTIELGGSAVSIQIDADFDDNGFSGDAKWKYSGGEDSSSFKAAPVPKRVLEDEWEHDKHHGHGHGPYGLRNAGGDAR